MASSWTSLQKDTLTSPTCISVEAPRGGKRNGHVIFLNGNPDRCYVNARVEIHLKTKNGEVVQKLAKTVMAEIGCPSG